MIARASFLTALLALVAGSASAQTPTCIKVGQVTTCTVATHTITATVQALSFTVPRDTVQLPAPPAVRITDTLYAPCMAKAPCPVVVTPPVVVAPPPPPPVVTPTNTLVVAFALLHRSRTIADTVTGYIHDSLGIQVTGSGAAALHWVVTHRQWWHVLTTAQGYSSDGSGVGNGVQHWNIQTGQRAGIYVDTFWVAAPPALGSPAMFLDSLLVTHNGSVVTPPPVSGPAPSAPPVAALPAITPDSTPLAAHPRVWMTPARVALLKRSAASNTVTWQRIKAAADAGLTDTSATAINTVPLLCEAYLATGNASYATAASRTLTRYAVDTNTVIGDSYYYYRFALPLVTAGLDWCYAGLAPAVHTQLAHWLMDRADAVWPETNPARSGGWAVHDAGDNYYWGFMMSGPAALAAFGDDPRAAYHRGLVESHWTLTALPFFAVGAFGGAWPEGSGYDSGGSVGTIADAFATAGPPLASTPWLGDALRWQLQQTTSNFLNKAAFGDQARVSDAPIFSYDRARVETLLPFADSALTAQSYAWMRAAGQQPYAEIAGTMTLANELLRFDPSITPATTLNALPLTATAAGPGYVVGRASHSTTATFWAYHAGSLGQSHQSLDANALMIWKGSYWITASANLWSQSGIEQSSNDFNTMTLDTLGQLHMYSNTGQPNVASIVATQLSDTLAVVRSQAANTYSVGLARPVTDFLRTMVYSPALDAFVIVDRVALTDSTRNKVFRWHSLHVSVSGQTFTLSTPTNDANCHGQVLTPATLGTQAFRLGADTTTVSSNAVTITTKAPVTVTVIQCGTVVPPSLALTSIAATITLGSRTLTIPTDAALPVLVH